MAMGMGGSTGVGAGRLAGKDLTSWTKNRARFDGDGGGEGFVGCDGGGIRRIEAGGRGAEPARAGGRVGRTPLGSGGAIGVATKD